MLGADLTVPGPIYLAKACEEIAQGVIRAVEDAIEAIDRYSFALVTGGMGDLFNLPIRIAKLIGWAGFAMHVQLDGGGPPQGAEKMLAGLITRIFDTYPLSLVAMSDAQAPYTLTALTAAARAGLLEEGERILGYLFSSSVHCGGRVARADIEPSKILGFLLARTTPAARLSIDMVAQPTELVLALIRASRLFGLVDEVDTSLSQLDHLALNAYLADDFRSFGDEMISGGINAVFHIGHDVWSLGDIETAWPLQPSPNHQGIRWTAVLASLLFPDRTPWFLLPAPAIIEGCQPEQATRLC